MNTATRRDARWPRPREDAGACVPCPSVQRRRPEFTYTIYRTIGPPGLAHHGVSRSAEGPGLSVPFAIRYLHESASIIPSARLHDGLLTEFSTGKLLQDSQHNVECDYNVHKRGRLLVILTY